MKISTMTSALILGVGLIQTGCKPSGSGGDAKTVIQVQGSDTMVNVAQAWAETYGKVKSDVSVEVGGGGSGVGFASLINGTIDIANASRDMKPGEKTKAKNNSGKEATEFTVGRDALAIFVHKDNPIKEITLEQLKNIYYEDGTTTKWSDLGITIPGCDSAEIVRVSRQSSSGTYAFFREHVLNKEDFKLGSTDLNGSKEVVELVQNTPCAIGYSGMGYANPNVKMVPVAKAKGETAYEPNLKNTVDKNYPIARALYIYTLGQPEGAAKEYIDWIMSAAGQKIVAESGYVPIGPAQ